DVEPELRQLERDVALDPGIDDLPHQREAAARGGIGLVERQDALAEQIEADAHAGGLDDARGRDRVSGRLAGDEAAREAGGLAQTVAGCEPLERATGGEAEEERL